MYMIGYLIDLNRLRERLRKTECVTIFSYKQNVSNIYPRYVELYRYNISDTRYLQEVRVYFYCVVLNIHD
jgi:hypothetical protein